MPPPAALPWPEEWRPLPPASKAGAYQPPELLRDLRLVIGVSRMLASERDLDRLLERIVDAAIRLGDADRGTLYVMDRERGDLWTRIAHGTNEFRLPLGTGIAGTVAATKTAINLTEAYADPRFDRSHDVATGYVTKNLLTLPLCNADEALVAVLQVINKRSQVAFDAYDREILSALCSQAAVAIDNILLAKRDREHQRMARDMELAHQIQRDLLPDHNPVLPGWRVAFDCRPCEQTGGDWIDLLIGPTSSDVVVADVSGHGLPAALVMTAARAFFRALHQPDCALEPMFERMNALLEHDIADDAFMSALLVRLHHDGRIEVVNAGHEPPLILRSVSGIIQRPVLGGPLMGVLPDMVFPCEPLAALAPGDLVVLFTDGLFEAQTADGSQYGMDRLATTVLAHAQEGAAGVRNAILADVAGHLAGHPGHDDLTLAVIERLP